MVRTSVVIAALVLVTVGATAIAREGARPASSNPAVSAWFKSLKIPNTETSCCDESDCKQVKARPHPKPSPKAEWQFEVDGIWVDVPVGRVLDKDSIFPSAVACWTIDEYTSKVDVYCFIPGAGM